MLAPKPCAASITSGRPCSAATASSAGISDLNLREKIAIAPVIAVLVFLGFYPKPALEVINPTTQTIMTNAGVSDPVAKVGK